jgi:hypothetical protein
MKTPHRPDYRVLQSSPSSTADPAKPEVAHQPEATLPAEAHRPNYAELQFQNETPPEIKSEEPPRSSNTSLNPHVPGILRHADSSLTGMDHLANERIKAMAFERAQLEELKQREALALEEQLSERDHTENEKPKTLTFFEDLHPNKDRSHDFER